MALPKNRNRTDWIGIGPFRDIPFLIPNFFGIQISIPISEALGKFGLLKNYTLLIFSKKLENLKKKIRIFEFLSYNRLKLEEFF